MTLQVPAWDWTHGAAAGHSRILSWLQVAGEFLEAAGVPLRLLPSPWSRLGMIPWMDPYELLRPSGGGTPFPSSGLCPNTSRVPSWEHETQIITLGSLVVWNVHWRRGEYWKTMWSFVVSGSPRPHPHLPRCLSFHLSLTQLSFSGLKQFQGEEGGRTCTVKNTRNPLHTGWEKTQSICIMHLQMLLWTLPRVFLSQRKSPEHSWTWQVNKKKRTQMCLKNLETPRSRCAENCLEDTCTEEQPWTAADPAATTISNFYPLLPSEVCLLRFIQ